MFQNQAAVAANEAQGAARAISLAAPGAQFRPGAGALGEALASFTDPLAQAASTDAETRYQEAVAKYQTANRDALDVYRQLSALAPEDSSALIRWAQAAEGSGEFAAAIKVYKTFVKRFPTDPLVVDARQKIKDLEAQQIAQQAAAGAQG